MRCTTHRFLAALLASSAIALIPQAALGEIIASSNFVDDGGDESIEGDTSGIGWAADGWTVQDTNLAGGILPIGMSYQVPGGGLVWTSRYGNIDRRAWWHSRSRDTSLWWAARKLDRSWQRQFGYRESHNQRRG